MFYSTELLSLRRKGKLARCWLAATVSEKMFKKTCKPALIKKIDVFHICEEILSTIEKRNGRSYGRFSLYLSSQLMYGVTKILFYQTKIFQDYMFEVSWKLLETNRRKEDSNVAISLELPDVPPINEVLRNVETSGLHLIAEEPYISVIEHLMQGEVNFGVLPNHEMEKFMFPETEELSLLVLHVSASSTIPYSPSSTISNPNGSRFIRFKNTIRKFHWDDSKEIFQEPEVQVPLIDIGKFEIEIIESEKETRLASARRDQRESLIDIEGQQFRNHAPVTPKKRTLKSPTETPSKRRKISSAEEPIPPLPPILSPTSVAVAAPISVPAISKLQQTALVLENVEFIEVTKQKRKKRYFDQQIKLRDAVMRKWIGNVKAHTIKHYLCRATLPSAKEYLTQPSMKVFNKLWGETLTKLFKQYLIKPVVQNEFQNVLRFEMEETIAGETIRADTSSKLRDQIGELSSKIAITTTETTDQSKLLEKILPADDYQVKESEEHKKRETKEHESLIGLPDITGFEEKIRESIVKPENPSGEKKSKSTSKSNSFCSKTCLTKRELLALMEIHWHEERLIKFHNLISPDNYNRIDAAYAFQYCLEFHSEKVVVLKQAEPFDIIWIEKYPFYSSESDEDATTT